MRLLVLGGTGWLGRTIVAEAAGRGSGAYDQVVAERREAVIDVTSQPGQVRGALAALEPVADRYLFVSSASVYADQRTLDQDESAPLLAPLAADVRGTMADYGQAKVACEQAVTGGLGLQRSLIAAPVSSAVRVISPDQRLLAVALRPPVRPRRAR